MKKNNSSPSKKKNILGHIISLLLGAALGAFIGIFGASYIDTLSGGNDALFFLYLGLGLILAYVAQIVLHEGGHLITGLMSGYRFVSFNILGFIWQKDANGKLRMGRMQIAGAGGQCLMAPPDYNGGNFPFTLYNLGGALANLVSAGIFALLMWLIPAAPLRILLLPQVLVGVLLGLANGLPIPVAAIQNDGTNLLCIRKDEHARRAFWVQMSIAAELARGTRLKDMPADWFATYPDEAMNNPIICAVAVMNTSRLMDQLDFDAAEPAITALLAREKGVLDLYRASMSCDGAVCELISGRPGPITSVLEEKNIQQILNAMKNHPTILRTRYALALLKENDEEQAQKYLANFEAAAVKHPNPQEIVSERELIAAIQNAHSNGGNP